MWPTAHPDGQKQSPGFRADDIVAAARRYALHKPSILDWGVAVDQTPNSLQTRAGCCYSQRSDRKYRHPGRGYSRHEHHPPVPCDAKSSDFGHGEKTDRRR